MAACTAAIDVENMHVSTTVLPPPREVQRAMADVLACPDAATLAVPGPPADPDGSARPDAAVETHPDAAQEAVDGAGAVTGHGTESYAAASAAATYQRKLEVGAAEQAPTWDADAYSQSPQFSQVTATGNPRQDVVIVASLISKVPNLAGLARTCEIYGVRSLVVPSLHLLRDKAFSSVSVTAESWLPIEAQPPQALPRCEAGIDNPHFVAPFLTSRCSYLCGLKSEGYRVLALEQTARSVSLESFEFPPKCAILLGREKEGVPPALLQVRAYPPASWPLARSGTRHVKRALTHPLPPTSSSTSVWRSRSSACSALSMCTSAGPR